MRFLGRSRERDVLHELLRGAREGFSAALVVRGDPGIGKTALLDHAADAATDFQVTRVTGVESEIELGFAGLHQLCFQMVDRFDRLPDPQAKALRVALGVQNGLAPDRFLVGLAVLSLLSDVANDGPVLWVVDDVQWLDQASKQVLGFVARRLGAESVVVLFGERTSDDVSTLAGLPEIVLAGLVDSDARELLASALPGRFDERVQERIVAEAQGNPLALLELPRGSTPAELAGGFGTGSVSARLEDGFRRRVGRLPSQTRQLMLIAAAEPLGDVELLRTAARWLGLAAGAAGPAEDEGLLRIRRHAAFRHPLVRSAIYHAASPEARRTVHRALGEVTDATRDPDRRAWHRAQAATQPNEGLAADLERSADQAKARGGFAAAAAFLELAARLTPEAGPRARRTLAAATAKHEAGDPGAAQELLAMAETGPLEELQRARAELLRAQIIFSTTSVQAASALLLHAAKGLDALDARLARTTYLEAVSAAIFVGRFDEAQLAAAAAAARAGAAAPHPARPLDLLLDALTARITLGYVPAMPAMRRAVHAYLDDETSQAEDTHWLSLACDLAVELWDEQAWRTLADAQVQLARRAGALTALPLALIYRAGAHIHAGEFALAGERVSEAHALSDAAHTRDLVYADLVLGAWRGEKERTEQLVAAHMPGASARGEGRILTSMELSSAVLYNGLGEYEAALRVVTRACQHDTIGFDAFLVPELIEAAVRCGRPDLAASALASLGEHTRASATPWAIGTELRCRALLSTEAEAEGLYRGSIDALANSEGAIHLARSRLLYGEWLRRRRRRAQSREQLRIAHHSFASMGANAFADRAARELRATGEHARARSPEAARTLTAQQAEVARLASAGHSNQEIAAQLFISPRTVEYHLHKVFATLGIRTRNQLARALAAARIPSEQETSSVRIRP